MSERHDSLGSMLDKDEAARKLRESGARMTAQRKAVIEVLSGNRNHPTAEQIEVRVRERLGCVAPATVYNTLEVLREQGFVRRIDGLEDRAHFDPDTTVHQHAICIHCRRVWDIEPISAPPDLPDGFVVAGIIIRGTCQDCDG